ADRVLRNPTTGTLGCCARAATGHAIAAPPSAASNSRRPMVTVMRPSRARCVKVTIRAPDVVGILRTSARTHPCSAGVDAGNLRSLRHFVVRRRAQDVTRARIGLLAQL